MADQPGLRGGRAQVMPGLASLAAVEADHRGDAEITDRVIVTMEAYCAKADCHWSHRCGSSPDNNAGHECRDPIYLIANPA